MESKFAFAKTLMMEAGAYIRQHLDEDWQIEEKSNFSDIVTDIDKQVQADLTRHILAQYPDDLILGEESEERPDINQGQVWVIDPIDGTTNFVAQKADFAVMLAYFEDGIGQFAFIYDVMADLLLHGGGQFPVYENDRLLPPAQTQDLHLSLIGVNAGMYAHNAYGVRDLIDQTLGARTYGSAGLTMSYVLKGRLLAYFSYICPWDYAAAAILGEKLGYTTCRINGQPLNFQEREVMMMVPKAQFAEIQKYLKIK